MKYFNDLENKKALINQGGTTLIVDDIKIADPFLSFADTEYEEILLRDAHASLQLEYMGKLAEGIAEATNFNLNKENKIDFIVDTFFNDSFLNSPEYEQETKQGILEDVLHESDEVRSLKLSEYEKDLYKGKNVYLDIQNYLLGSNCDEVLSVELEGVDYYHYGYGSSETVKKYKAKVNKNNEIKELFVKEEIDEVEKQTHYSVNDYSEELRKRKNIEETAKEISEKFDIPYDIAKIIKKAETEYRHYEDYGINGPGLRVFKEMKFKSEFYGIGCDYHLTEILDSGDIEKQKEILNNLFEENIVFKGHGAMSDKDTEAFFKYFVEKNREHEAEFDTLVENNRISEFIDEIYKGSYVTPNQINKAFIKTLESDNKLSFESLYSAVLKEEMRSKEPSVAFLKTFKDIGNNFVKEENSKEMKSLKLKYHYSALDIDKEITNTLFENKDSLTFSPDFVANQIFHKVVIENNSEKNQEKRMEKLSMESIENIKIDKNKDTGIEF